MLKPELSPCFVRTLLPAAVVWAGVMIPQQASFAFDGPSLEAVPGAWEISEPDGTRKCRIMLRAETAAAGEHLLSMPAGCKRAFPVLGDAGGWTISNDKHIAIADRAGQTVLAFAPAEDDRLIATGPHGETYELEPAGRPKQAVAQAQPSASAPAPSATSPSATRPGVSPGIRRVPAANSPAATAPLSTTAAAEPSTTSPVRPFPGHNTDLAGRYNILRENDKDVGCLLALDGAARGPGGNKAQLAPACRDQGIVVFDPVSWRFDRGFLVLRARKGHDARFLYHADGVWRKDPKEGGKPLGLKTI
jgi:hypothetical protein